MDGSKRRVGVSSARRFSFQPKENQVSEDKKKSLVYKSAVKEVAGKLRLRGDFVEALSDKVAKIVEAAVKRAEDNDRVTLRPSDL